MRKLVAGLVVGLALAGCGSSSDLNVGSNSAQGVSPPGIVGRVVSSTGSPLAGVQVVAHERTTNEKVTDVSDGRGAFSLEVVSGVYDVGIDLESDPTMATCFYGPITVASSVQRDFVLHSNEGRPTGQVFGKLWLSPGIPAAQRRVTLRTGYQHGDTLSDRPDPVSATTGGDGSFALVLGTEFRQGVDVEVYEQNGELDEWIDISKLDKPCYVEFSTAESPIENRLRCNESDFDGPVTEAETLAQGTTVIPFADAAVIGGDEAKLALGLIPVGAPKQSLAEMVLGGPPDDPQHQKLWNVIKNMPIEVNTKGDWFYKYAVNIKPRTATDWAFTDETNDTYQLWVSITLWGHKVSYNSDKPNIHRIDFDLSSI